MHNRIGKIDQQGPLLYSYENKMGVGGGGGGVGGRREGVLCGGGGRGNRWGIGWYVSKLMLNQDIVKFHLPNWFQTV